MHFSEGLTIKGRCSNIQPKDGAGDGCSLRERGPQLITPSCLLHFTNGTKLLWKIFLFLQISAKMWIENGPRRIPTILFNMIVTGW